jgi:hypothetical protein
MSFTRFQWAGVRVYENKVPRRILKGSFRGRGPTVKLRSRWEDEMRESAVKIAKPGKWCAVARCSSDERIKNREGHGKVMGSKKKKKKKHAVMMCLKNEVE